MRACTKKIIKKNFELQKLAGQFKKNKKGGFYNKSKKAESEGPPLEAIAKAATKDDGLEFKSEEVVVTNGGKQAIFNTMATLINPGDEVILQAPFWVTYPEAVQIFGGKPVVINSDETTNYKIAFCEIREARKD